MKITIVNQPGDLVQPPRLNSVGLWTYKTSEILAKHHNITIYTTQTNISKEMKGIIFQRINAFSNRTNFRLSRLFAPFFPDDYPSFASVFYQLEYITQVAARVRKEKPDIIHVHTFPQFVTVLRAFNPDSKILLHVNNEWLVDLARERVFPHIARADMIIACSKNLTDKIKKRFPELAERCFPVYNGVDIHQFPPRSIDPRVRNRTKKILFVSRLSPEKGAHDLIKAFNLVVSMYPQIELHLIGQKAALRKEFVVTINKDPHVQALNRFYNKRKYFEQLQEIATPEAARRIRFWGQVSHEEIPGHYQDADVLVNPSLYETFGISLIEGMSSELPVVATNVGGMVEILVNGKNGYLVPPADPEKLADAILKLLVNDQLNVSMGKAGRKRVMGKFTWKAVAKEVLERYGTATRL